MKNIRSLKKSKYFKDLEDQDLHAIIRCIGVQIRSFYKDETIVSDGDSTNNIYIIFSGTARSFTLDIDGNRKILSDYTKDSIFGLEAYYANLKYYHEYLKAVTDCEVLICDAFRFVNPCQNRCKRHVDLMKATIYEMSRELFNDKKRISYTIESKTRDKVLSYLKSVKASVKRSVFEIPYNRQELADYLGLERSALSCELSKMKKEGIIDFDKNTFKIIV